MPIEPAASYDELEAQLQTRLRSARTHLFELSMERDTAIKQRGRLVSDIEDLNAKIAVARQDVFLARAELRVLLNEKVQGSS